MLEVCNLNKSFGGVQVAVDINLKLKEGERRSILGPNGAGKTTLFNLLAGTLAPDSGAILFQGKNITSLNIEKRARLGISRSFQRNFLFDDFTIRENLLLAASAAQGTTTWLWRDGFNHSRVRATVEQVAEQLALADLLDTPVKSVSYGNRRQLELGIALASKPRILLLDEPTSGIGPAMMESFHALITALPRELTILIVEHDFDLVFKVADYITVLNFGAIVYEGTPQETKKSPKVRDIYLGSSK